MATSTPGYFDRPDRINHEARQYAQEYLDQYQRWHAGDIASVSPAWQVAFQAAQDQSVTALGDVLLQLNAHIRRDNAIRAIEQSEGVLRVQGDMPAASGRPDHERVSDVLQDALVPMLTRLARRYDPTIDDARPGPRHGHRPEGSLPAHLDLARGGLAQRRAAAARPGRSAGSTGSCTRRSSPRSRSPRWSAPS